MWIEGLPLLPLVAVDGLLLVQLADVVLGILGVLPLTCHRGDEGWKWTTERQEMNWDYS